MTPWDMQHQSIDEFVRALQYAVWKAKAGGRFIIADFIDPIERRLGFSIDSEEGFEQISVGIRVLHASFDPLVRLLMSTEARKQLMGLAVRGEGMFQVPKEYLLRFDRREVV